MAEAGLDDISRVEQRKYEKAWRHDRYRRYSPGEDFFRRAWEDMKPQPHDTLCDWGIGGGQAAQMFADRGIKVEGIDLARNANKHFNGKVWIGSLWDPPFPKDKCFNLGYCTDVMEHIPPEKVLQTLRQMRNFTTDEIWFAIATFPDKEGEHIGEKLHLTVRGAPWWAKAFGQVFPRFVFYNDIKHVFVKAFTVRL